LVDEAIEQPVEAFERVRPSDAQLASLAELRRFRDRLERFARELAVEYDALLGRVMTGLSSAPARPSSAAAPAPTFAPSAAAPAFTTAPAAPAPATAAPETSEAESRENALFEGRVELGVGPFYDIASLGAFERRLASLPGVSEASVRRFEASHAVVDVRLAAPVALVRELRRAAGSDFSVREVASGRILLTFDES
jgi:pyruvate/2-oxoglutarate dehydrogenase complex dihydrolipoamide acyltransferase (E2) component